MTSAWKHYCRTVIVRWLAKYSHPEQGEKLLIKTHTSVFLGLSLSSIAYKNIQALNNDV